MSVSLILKPGGKAQCLAEVAVDGHTMLLIGSAIVALLFIVDVMLGSGGISVPRWARERSLIQLKMCYGGGKSSG